jgi:carboxyl-terminal processing protease
MRPVAFLKHRCVTLALGGLFSLLTLHGSVALAATPQELYDEVWRIVSARYVDEQQNHQDWRIWRHRYDDKMKTSEDAYVAIETMVSSLGDRYTRFLDPEEFAEETRGIQAKLYGIGIQIGIREDKIVVIAPMEDTPADKAGIKAGDEIVSIDGKSTKGLSIKDGADLIRGEKGTKVKVGVLREGKPLNFVVMRDEIKLVSVSTKHPFDVKLPPEVGYVKLSTFLSKTAAEELKTIIEGYSGKKGLILDLRSNPGGLLTNANIIADFFLKGGSIVSTVDRNGYKTTTYASERVLSNQPLVVLIDGGSASASEILSGALKDHQRATLVGMRTFGKGLVQEINPLSDGAGLNVTNQRYLTPNDTDIHKKGISPDYEVKVTEEDIKAERDPQLAKAIDVLRQDYGLALSTPKVNSANEKGKAQASKAVVVPDGDIPTTATPAITKPTP